MTESITDLYPSLVGVSLEFKVKGEPLKDAYGATRKQIMGIQELSNTVGRELATVLLGEMVSFFMGESYYPAVRGAFELGRRRPMIMEYLKGAASERLENLLNLSVKIPPSKREALIIAIRYFVKKYPRHLQRFKASLTKDEYFSIS